MGQLDKRKDEFAAKGVDVYAISVDGLEDAAKTQADLASVRVISDADRRLLEGLELAHEGAKTPNDGTVYAPTTLITDGAGKIVWRFRPSSIIERLDPDVLMTTLDGLPVGN